MTLSSPWLSLRSCKPCLLQAQPPRICDRSLTHPQKDSIKAPQIISHLSQTWDPSAARFRQTRLPKRAIMSSFKRQLRPLTRSKDWLSTTNRNLWVWRPPRGSRTIFSPSCHSLGLSSLNRCKPTKRRRKENTPSVAQVYTYPFLNRISS